MVRERWLFVELSRAAHVTKFLKGWVEIGELFGGKQNRQRLIRRRNLVHQRRPVKSTKPEIFVAVQRSAFYTLLHGRTFPHIAVYTSNAKSRPLSALKIFPGFAYAPLVARFSILAHVSRRPIVRLKTTLSPESRSTQ